jgi:hypothetical protein
VVRSAQQGLYADWRACRVEAYPEDPEAGVKKMSSTVEFKRAGRKTRGVLTVGFHKLDGKEVSATRLQAAFARCVKQRFEGRRFHSGSPSQVGKRWALANPFPGYRVIQNGELGTRPAAAYVLHRLAKARAACSVSRAKRGLEVLVDTNPDGSAGAVAVTGAEKSACACLRRRLKKTLRFPVVAKASQVSVTD